jgi:hypothetical protein
MFSTALQMHTRAQTRAAKSRNKEPRRETKKKGGSPETHSRITKADTIMSRKIRIFGRMSSFAFKDPSWTNQKMFFNQAKPEPSLMGG